jgi:hypothetical protein
MQNKSKSWADIQMIISSISIAVTLGFWSLFSSSQKVKSGVSADANFPSQPDPSTISQNDMLVPGQVMLLNGSNLAQQSATPTSQVTQAPAVQRKHKGGGGSGGGSGSVTNTSSSHP